jgi:hypothetical protein
MKKFLTLGLMVILSGTLALGCSSTKSTDEIVTGTISDPSELVTGTISDPSELVIGTISDPSELLEEMKSEEVAQETNDNKNNLNETAQEQNDNKNKFVDLPQEKIVITRKEGFEYPETMTLHKGSGYAIYIDKTFKFEKQGEMDVFSKVRSDDKSVKASISITQDLQKTPEELAISIKNELKNQFINIKEEPVSRPFDSIKISADSFQDGEQFKTGTVNVYLVDNQKGGTFVIREDIDTFNSWVNIYEFHEMFRPNMDNMLKEFKVL